MTRPEDVDEVRRQLLHGLEPLGGETLHTGDASGRVLAADVVCPTDLPPADRSAMDGFAVSYDDLSSAEGSATLTIAGAAMAGGPPSPGGGPSTAVRIATGADVPRPYDTVVRIEDATVDGMSVTVPSNVSLGRNVRLRGEDAVGGEVLVRAGTRLSATRLAGLLGAGVPQVHVVKRPRVRVVPTGDELLAGGTHDALSRSLLTLFSEMGASCSVAQPLPDEQGPIREAVRAALTEAEVVVTTGGASVGPRDHAGAVAEQLGGRRVQLALRPGRPFAYATGQYGRLLCLPGSPVAALAVAILLARPVVARVAGLQDSSYGRERSRLMGGRPIEPSDVRRMLPVVLCDDGARVVDGHGAGDLARLARSDGFVEVLAHTTVQPGDDVVVHRT